MKSGALALWALLFSVPALATPSSYPEMVDSLTRFQAEVKHGAAIQSPGCAEFLGKWDSTIRHARWQKIAPSNAQERQHLRDHGRSLLQGLFEARIEVRERALAQPACEPAVRRLMTTLRISEEVLGGWLVGKGKILPINDESLRAFHPGWTLSNPRFGSWAFEPGDVILDRGGSYISAMIARIGDSEALFSHLTIVGQDPQGKLYLVEISTEDLKKIETLESWLEENPDPRMAVYRHKDRELARRAGRMIYDHFKARIAREGRIRYDFAMDDSDHSTLFCSEVVLLAYKLASNGAMVYPAHRTTVSKFSGNKFEMLNRLGIKGRDFPAPVDIDTDPRFELVAEFRDYGELQKIRMEDAILSSVYEWLNEKGYKFGANPGMFVISGGLSAASKVFSRMPVPGNMPRGAIDLAIRIEKLGAAIASHLEPKVLEAARRSEFPMDFWEMKRINEEHRRADCLLFQRSVQAAREEGLGQAPGNSVAGIHQYVSSAASCPALVR